MLRDLFSLFPAYAGVILLPRHYPGGNGAFPRIRGGDPADRMDMKKLLGFSPHMRGVIPPTPDAPVPIVSFSPHTRG